MTNPTNPEGGGPGDAKTTRGFVTRIDLDTAAIVEEGLALLATQGLEYASAYLSSHMVPLAVAHRALLKPPERRRKVG